MKKYKSKILDLLPDFKDFKDEAFDKTAMFLDGIPDKKYAQWLRETNGGYAYDGALRFFSVSSVTSFFDIESWNSEKLWKVSYENLRPISIIFCEDAFGQQYMFDGNGRVLIFWPETGEAEPLDCLFLEFLQLIENSPNDTISLDLYTLASKKFRKPKLNEHFAFKVETAIGGSINIDNLTIMNSIDHMHALGNIAQQIASLPIGAKLIT